MSIPPVGSSAEQPATPARTRYTFDRDGSPVAKIRRVTQEPGSPMAIDAPASPTPATPPRAVTFSRVPPAPRKARNPNPHVNIPGAAQRVL